MAKMVTMDSPLGRIDIWGSHGVYIGELVERRGGPQFHILRDRGRWHLPVPTKEGEVVDREIWQEVVSRRLLAKLAAFVIPWVRDNYRRIDRVASRDRVAV